MRFFCFAFVSLLLATTTVRSQTDVPGPGVPLAIAEERAENIHNLRYALTLTVTELARAPIAGEATLHFSLKDPGKPLVLDFATTAAHVLKLNTNGKPGHTWVNGHIVIPAAVLRTGDNVLEIQFTAGDESLNRSADFLYALFVPARARLAIPCFDQPSLKARWKLSVRVPRESTWQVVGNGALVTKSEVPSDESRSDQPAGMLAYQFAESAPLPTYLFSFAIGDFKIESAERDGRTMRMFHRETDAAKVARNKDAIFDLHAQSLGYLERYTGIPYAFGKFDFVMIPAFQFGGMEHAGAIFYNANSMLLDESATQNQLLGRASTIAHETAHMWFGDLVTMRWFNDVWMKEVFANFMAAKIVNPAFPTVNHDLRFLLSHYPGAYDVDRTQGANPIRQPLDNLADAGSLYGAIIYQKAPIVMRHLESVLGEESFRDGVREYLKAHAFGNATWSDLIAVLNRRSPQDLAIWSQAWVDESGRPTVKTEVKINAAGHIERLAFSQSDAWNRQRTWPQELRVTMGYADKSKSFKVQLTGASAEIPAAAGQPMPNFILPNGGGWAYGNFVLDQASLDYLSRSIPAVSDPLTRGAAWVALWDSMLEGALPAAKFIDLAILAAPLEKDEQLTARILGYLRHAWWQFLSGPERTARIEKLEEALRAGLSAATTPSQKSAWFGTLSAIAATPGTLGWLQRIWSEEEVVMGLPFAEADFASLAQELAVREVEGWKGILTRQLARMKNPDRKARFAFAIPALSADATEREHWFLSLSDVTQRRREPWVLDGLTFLHHPLRAAASEKYIRPSLALLEEIQRTGDIFFPNRWVAATLSGHSTASAAAIVRQFLAGLPSEYPHRLRAIILQNTDDLFRSVR